MIKYQNLKIGIIGCGNMGESILYGIIDSEIVPPRNIFISDIKDLSPFKKKLAINISSNKELCEKSDIIIIAVKPNQVENILNEIKDNLSPNKLLISIAAGISTKKIEKFFKNLKIPVIRVMPNLPIKVRSGIIGYSCGKYSKGKEKIIEEIFTPLGEVFKIKEEKMDLITAISGSGPGYFFYIAEIIEKICRKKGLDANISKTISKSLLFGTGKMLLETNYSAKKLKEMVSSPGGTTLAGISVLKNKKIEKILKETIESAEKRSRELSKSFEI